MSLCFCHALMARSLSFPYVVAIFFVCPVAILLSAPIIPNRLFCAPPTTAGESCKLDRQRLPQIEIEVIFHHKLIHSSASLSTVLVHIFRVFRSLPEAVHVRVQSCYIDIRGIVHESELDDDGKQLRCARMMKFDGASWRHSHHRSWLDWSCEKFLKLPHWNALMTYPGMACRLEFLKVADYRQRILPGERGTVTLTSSSCFAARVHHRCYSGTTFEGDVVSVIFGRRKTVIDGFDYPDIGYIQCPFWFRSFPPPVVSNCDIISRLSLGSSYVWHFGVHLLFPAHQRSPLKLVRLTKLTVHMCCSRSRRIFGVNIFSSTPHQSNFWFLYHQTLPPKQRNLDRRTLPPSSFTTTFVALLLLI